MRFETLAMEMPYNDSGWIWGAILLTEAFSTIQATVFDMLIV